MNFQPQLKPKKFKCTKNNPFPKDEKFQAIFTGFTVEIINKLSIITLYENGCFGKGSHNRSAPEVVKYKEPLADIAKAETLILDLEEAYFLHHTLEILEISDIDGNLLTSEEVFNKFLSIKEKFLDTFIAYLYLKSKNWCVRSGIKFGGDFLLYKQGPRFYHASFIVIITCGSPASQRDIQGLERIAETSDKNILYLKVHHPQGALVTRFSDFSANLQNFTVSVNVAKRMDFKQFVQAK